MEYGGKRYDSVLHVLLANLIGRLAHEAITCRLVPRKIKLVGSGLGWCWLLTITV